MLGTAILEVAPLLGLQLIVGVDWLICLAGKASHKLLEAKGKTVANVGCKNTMEPGWIVDHWRWYVGVSCKTPRCKSSIL